jgi:Zn-dependent protease with chaperone function
MYGTIFLIVRVAVYFIGGWLASMGWAEFDATSGVLSFDANGIVTMLTGVAMTLVMFVVSRKVKARGGAT